MAALSPRQLAQLNKQQEKLLQAASLASIAVVAGSRMRSAVGRGARSRVERLWHDFFTDPSQWWDHRAEKVKMKNTNFPDFKHKKTQEALWLNNRSKPPWVEAKLAALPPDAVQSHFFSWNSTLSRHVKAKEYEQAMKLFQKMQQEDAAPDKFTFISVLNACTGLGLRALEEGRAIHLLVTKTGHDSDVYVGSSLVNMYAKCGEIEDAGRVFDILPRRDAVAWNTMITGYVKCGQGRKALDLAKQMVSEGVEPVPVTFVEMANACSSVGVGALEEGRLVHQQIIQRGYISDRFVGNSLIDMYAKCGSIEEAWRVFSDMTCSSRDVVAWNSMIVGYVKCGRAQQALELFHRMQQQEGLEPSLVTFVGLLNACARLSALEEGRRIHEQISQRRLELDVVVASSLVDMYAKCGSSEEARRIFTEMPTRNAISWNAMILGYAKSGQANKAIELYHQMLQQQQPDSGTFVGVLKACASVGPEALEVGRRVHEHIIQRGFESHVFVGNSLVDMYAKCTRTMEDLEKMFNSLPKTKHDVVGWNAMILGHVKRGQRQKALELYHRMHQEGVELVFPITFAGLLNACASDAALEEGRRLHQQIIQSGCDLTANVLVTTSLVDMYTKCGSLEDASRVFDSMPTFTRKNVVIWNTMILGCVKCGQGEKALELFHRMMQQEGVEPVAPTFVGVFNACASIGFGALSHGRHIHELVVKHNCESNAFVGNSLIDMYAKCGSIDEARGVFDRMPSRDVVGWNSMILGYVKCGEGHKALKLSRRMMMRQEEGGEGEGVEPDAFTFVGLLNACASVGCALEEGKLLHEQIVSRGWEWELDVFINSSLVDMYAKCGSIDDACGVFSKISSSTTNVVAWNAMLGGLAMHGRAKEVLAHFHEMLGRGVEVDAVTFVSLLSACSHAGLTDEGLHYFHSMSPVYGVSPSVKHYACMVDLLGRAGRLQEAEDLIETIPCAPDAIVWMSLLGACTVHGSAELGERVAKRVLELHPRSSSGYVLLSNLYGAASRWDSRENVQRLRTESGVGKQPGRTWIEVNNEVHSFRVDDQDHPRLSDIHAELRTLTMQMKEMGYVPDTRFALHDVDEEKKVSLLSYHSEKLAIAFGLLSTGAGTPLRIFKNLRVCGDCHTAIKFITKVVERTITVRDANRFHHFQDGFCSCDDFW